MGKIDLFKKVTGITPTEFLGKIKQRLNSDLSK